MSVENAGANAQDPLVGSLISGRYRIVKKLGEGGMGAVYIGEQQMGTNLRKVAVKTLHPHLSHDPKILARFEREVGVISELQHPNTIQVFDFGKTETGLLYIVMEFIQGRSVAQILEQDGPMDPQRVVKILTQVCGSLQEAHQMGIVHRDLKPDNVVLCDKAGQKDWVEVLDFGIAKRSTEEDKEESKLTQQGMVLGTPPYMSPEQFTGKPVDSRSDIYSLAIMAYEMLTGRLPFAGNTAWEWASAHMTAPPVPIDLTPTGPRIPAAMKSAIARALAKRPEDRYESVTEFLHAFTGATADTQPIAVLEAQAAQKQVRAKTEVGTPLDVSAGFGAPGAYGAPPPGMGHPGAMVPPHAAAGTGPGVVMAPGPGARKKSGGGKGMLLGIAGVVGVLSIGAIVFALRGTSSSATPEPATSTTAPSTVMEPVATSTPAPGTATAAPPPVETPDQPLPPLVGDKPGSTPKPSGGTKPSTTAPKPPGTAAPGTPAPTTPPATTPPATTTPPVTPPAASQTEKLCAAARSMLARDPSSPAAKALAEKCKAAGGTL